MSVPTPEQRLRSAFRALAKERTPEDAVQIAGRELLAFADAEHVAKTWLVPRLMGAADAADALGMFTTNIKRLSPPLPEVTRISRGSIPVFLEADVLAVKARRNGTE